MASQKQKRAKSAKKDAEKPQDVYSCTNQEVLNALFIGVNVVGTTAPVQTSATQANGLSQPVGSTMFSGVIDLSDDSSAEEEEDLLRKHSRIMKQQEFEQIQRDGYVQQRSSSQLNQLDNSSRQNLVESGSLQMQNSTSSPPKSNNIDQSPDGNNHAAQQQLQQHSSTFGNDQSMGYSQSGHNPMVAPLFAQNINIDPNNSSANAVLMSDQKATQGMLISPQQQMVNNVYDFSTGNNNQLVHPGSLSNRQRSGSRKKRGRPISAYPVPGSYPGGLSQISESVESTQASHFVRFTDSMARTNAQRKQYVPHNIDTFEKEKLYTDTITLKKQRNDMSHQNTLLKTNLKAAELDLRKKDQLIAQLTNDIKISANSQGSGYFPFNTGVNQSSFMHLSPELQGVTKQFTGSRHQKQVSTQAKGQQLIKQNSEFRTRIKELKCDVALKQTEVQNLQRTLKFTKLKEFEIEIQTYGQEILRLKQMLINEKTKPKVSPQQFAMLQNQLLAERQQMGSLAQQNEVQRQDIEKLTQAHAQSKIKLQKSKAKLKKLSGVKKRQETKIKVLEQKVSVNTAQNSLKQQSRGSRQLKQSNVNGFGGESETYDQLQTQLEINQILIDKLDSMNVDVRELIRTSQLSSGDLNGQQSNNTNIEPYVRTVIFTFIGPEGLIEGGDNQQFEMPIDFNQVSQVDQIKDILKKELVMDVGIDLVLREKSSGQILNQIGDVHIAIDSGDGILVQFVEGGDVLDQQAATSNNGNMAHINEEDEKSEYSDEQFEDEDEGDQEAGATKKIPLIPRVTAQKVASGLKQIKLMFMIKKVPRTHMVKYLLQGEKIERDQMTGEEQVSSKTLAQIFERKFNFVSKKATKIARFFSEVPAQDDSLVEARDHMVDRETLIQKFKEHIADYMLYNTLALDSMLSRLQGIMDGKQTEFLDDLNLEDDFSNGFLTFEQIQKVWKYSGNPSLDEELTEFLEFIALRCSTSLKKVHYEDYCKVFEDNFTLNADCKHDDASPFDASNEESDQQDLQAIHQRADTAANTATGKDIPLLNDQSANGATTNPNDEDGEPEIESDDLMLYIDEALNKIVSQLPKDKRKTVFNQKLLPLAKSTEDQQRNETVLVLQPQVFIQFMVQTLGIQFSDKELYCLLHILVRETETQDQLQQQSYSQPQLQAQNNLNMNNQTESGYILYRDVYTLIRNYLRKEKIMGQSISMGLDYQVLTKPTFDFLLRIKQILNKPPNVKPSEETEKPTSTVDVQNFRNVFSKQIVTKKMNSDIGVDLIEFDDFFDGLFMKFKIMCPPKDTLEQLKFLLCVQFGPNIKELSYFLVQKMERILYDLDYVYVNLVKILREPKHDNLQQEALKRLKQRYDFVARGISKSTVKAPTIAPQEDDVAEEVTSNVRQNKNKPRPMSSKPRKPALNTQSAEQKKKEKKKVAIEEPSIDEYLDEDDNDIDDNYEDPDIDNSRAVKDKVDYSRQKTKDIDFELPNDSDDVDDDEIDNYDDDDDDIEDEGVSEDDEAQIVSDNKNKGGAKKQPLMQQMSDKSDDIDDEYSDIDQDDDQDVNPPIQETKTLKQIVEDGKGNKNGATKGNQQTYNGGIPQDDGGIMDDDGLIEDDFVEDEILDDYD